MQRSSVVFFTNNSSGTGCYYKHIDLGLIDTYGSAAYSVIVSLAEYLVWRFPQLSSPGTVRNMEKLALRLDYFPNYACGMDQMYRPWINIFLKAVESQNLIRNNSDCYYKVQVSNDYGDQLQLQGFEKVDYEGEFKWSMLSSELKEPSTEEKRIIIDVSCSKIETRQFFYGEFFNNQKWVYFNVLDGNIPTKEDLAKASVVIVPGGQNSVYDQIPQISKFSNILSEALNENKHLKCLGICFGAQLLTHCLGGTVGKSDKLHSGMLTARVVREAKNSFPFKQYEEFFQNSELKMIQYHGDEIKELPPNFEIIANSPCTQKQIIASKDGRLLGIQAHPEYGVERSRTAEIQDELQKNNNFDEVIKIIERKDQYDETSVIRRMMSQFLSCN